MDIQDIFTKIKNLADSALRDELKALFMQTRNNDQFANATFKLPSQTVMYNYASSTAEADKEGMGLFAFAVQNKKWQTAALLLNELGADILKHQNKLGENGFHAVAQCEDANFRAWFLTQSPAKAASDFIRDASQAPINAQSTKKETALTITAAHADRGEEIVHWLAMAANPLLSDEAGENAMHHACKAGSQVAVQTLHHYNPTLVHSTSKDGSTTAHFATAVDILQFLQACHVSLVSQNLKFERPVHKAVMAQNEAAINFLLQLFPNVMTKGGGIEPHINTVDGDFNSLLHLLIYSSHAKPDKEKFEKILRLLLNLQIDITLVNAKSETAMTTAKEKLNADLFAIFYEQITALKRSPLFTLDTLMEAVSGLLSLEQAQALRQHLQGQLAVQQSNPIGEIQLGFMQILKERICAHFEHNAVMRDAMLGVLQNLADPQQPSNSYMQTPVQGRVVDFRP